MSQIRLAIVRQKYRPDGGAERFISRALSALNQHNLSLNVITREWQGEKSPDWNILTCNPIKWGRISRERGFAFAARAIWEREKFDLVQSHERIAGCDIYRAGDGVHRQWLQQRARILPNWKQKLLFTDRYHRYVMNAEQEMYTAPELKAVICNAEMVKQEIIQNFNLPEDKITVIYNSIDHNHFTPGSEINRIEVRNKLSISLTASCLIFVGSGFERKGLSAAIQAIAKTDHYLIVIGKDKKSSQYEAQAKTLGCHNRVRFLGMQNETLPYYQACDGLLLPTLYDPFPNVILEALSCGLPVVTSTTCGGAEFINQGHEGYVCDALDINALKDAITALPKAADAEKMSQAARCRIMDYTPENLSRSLINLYEKVLQK